jgi:hypothetical protein
MLGCVLRGVVVLPRWAVTEVVSGMLESRKPIRAARTTTASLIAWGADGKYFTTTPPIDARYRLIVKQDLGMQGIASQRVPTVDIEQKF